MPASNSRDQRHSEDAARRASKTTEPLRGNAAWRAEVQEIAKRNDAARAAGVRQRAANDATVADEAAERARREMRTLRDNDGR